MLKDVMQQSSTRVRVCVCLTAYAYRVQATVTGSRVVQYTLRLRGEEGQKNCVNPHFDESTHRT